MRTWTELTIIEGDDHGLEILAKKSNLSAGGRKGSKTEQAE